MSQSSVTLKQRMAAASPVEPKVPQQTAVAATVASSPAAAKPPVRRPSPAAAPPKVTEDPPLFNSKANTAPTPLKVLSDKIDPKMPSEAVVLTDDGKANKVIVKVKDGIMFVYTKIGDVYVQLKVKINDSVATARDSALKELTKLTNMLEPYKVKMQDRVILVKAKITDTGTQIKAKAIEYRDDIQLKVLEKYNNTKNAIVRITPSPIQKAFVVSYEKGTQFYVFVKDNTIVIYGKVSDTTVCIKAKGFETYEAAQRKAAELIDKVMSIVRSNVNKVKDGLTSMKCRVDGAVVSIKTSVIKGKDLTKAKVAALYAQLSKVVGDSMLMKKLSEGCTFVQDKATGIKIYVQDGYAHITAVVGDKTLYVKAKIVKVKDQVTLVIVEKYITTRDIVLELIKKAQAAVTSATDKTKLALADKPVSGGAATGAAVLGTAGGATGGVVGLCAGAACGVPLAIFTLGLSIPVGAVIGGGAGVAVGAAAGGTAGAAGGAAAGYGYEHRAQINKGVDSAMSKMSSSSEAIKKRLPKIASWSSTGGTK